MRRIEQDERNELNDLLALRPPERLFVQRWIELFDRENVMSVRSRPVESGRIRVELDAHDRPDYHEVLLKEELERTEPVPTIGDIDLRRIPSDPVGTAESLGRAVSALGFSHSFLFHGYKSMLYPPDSSFGQRLDSMCAWWTANSARLRQARVYFRTTSGGFRPDSQGIALVHWSDLESSVAGSARRCTDWWRLHEQSVLEDCFFVEIAVFACDPNAAAALALEHFGKYVDVLRGSPQKPLGLDREWVFVDDPDQLPSGKTYAIRLSRREFRARRPFPRSQVAALAAACSSDSAFATFWHHLSSALDDVFRGTPGDALDDIAKALDLACGDYSDAQRTGPPRTFVDVASKLLALNSLNEDFADLMEYLLKPSFCVPIKPFDGDKRPESVFDGISNDASWSDYIRHCDWDELLKYRRDRFLAKLRSVSGMLAERRQVAQWDLARAIRARNSLFHRGEPLQDDYLLALLIDAFCLLARLRVKAIERGLPVEALLQCAVDDFDRLVSHQPGQDARSLAVWGWRQWKSARGNSLPAGD